MVSTLIVTCNSPVEDQLRATPEAHEEVQKYKHILEIAGVTILKTLLIPSENNIAFVIDADGFEAARKAFAGKGIHI